MEGDGTSNTGCRLRQDTDDNGDWSRNAGKTPSGFLNNRNINNDLYPVTGPSDAIQGTYYSYTEASGTNKEDLFR